MFQGQVASVGGTRAQAGLGRALSCGFTFKNTWSCELDLRVLPALFLYLPPAALNQVNQPRPASITHRPKGASSRWRLPKVYTTPPRGLDNILGILLSLNSPYGFTYNLKIHAVELRNAFTGYKLWLPVINSGLYQFHGSEFLLSLFI